MAVSLGSPSQGAEQRAPLSLGAGAVDEVRGATGASQGAAGDIPSALQVQAKSLVSWQVLEPGGGLPGWRATSARIEPATKVSAGPIVAFGFVTPSGAWLGVKQAGVRAASAPAWVRSVLEGAGDVSGSTLRSTGGASYLVYGTGTEAERRALLGALGLRP